MNEHDANLEIPLDSPRWDSISERISSTFTPAAPVANRDLFAGRATQLADLRDATFQIGQHAVIYGERGVGKTSLASWLEAAQKTSHVAIKVNCDATDDFSTLWSKALEEVELLRTLPGISFGNAAASVAQSVREGIESPVTPHDVRRLVRGLASVAGRSVFYFDEFDRLEDRHVRARFADTVKMLSDQMIDTTLVIIGVGDTIHELIEEHESVQRAIVQVKMPRMDESELKEVLKRGFETVGMRIDDSSKEMIAMLSQGFPHYTHLLGQAAARNALNQGRLQVVEEDVYAAMVTAVRKAQQTITDDYVKATSSARKDALYADVLLASALADGDDLGYFSASEIRPHLFRVTKRDYEVSAYNRHLAKLASAERGPALLRKGQSRATRYRFKNPMLQPHVLIKGLVSGKLSLKTD